ncbi:MAG: LolA family protein [Candidatus Zixiibacteriota bacterium]
MKRIIVAITVMMFFLGCASQVRRFHEEAVDGKTYQYDNLMGKANIIFKSQGKGNDVDTEIYIKRPDNLRLDIFMPFVGNAARIIMKGDKAILYDFFHNEIIIPENNSNKLFEDIIGIQIDTKILMDLLLFAYISPENPTLNQKIHLSDNSFAIYNSVDLDFPPEIMYFMTDKGDTVRIEYKELFLEREIDDEIFDAPKMKNADTLRLVN